MASIVCRAKPLCAAILTAAGCLAAPTIANDGATTPSPFTDAEIKAIVAHGPYPAPVAIDPTNRVSGRHEAAEFGTKLFFDERLSGNGKVSCGTCHVPERAWSDNERRSVGVAEVKRNTPTLVNLPGARWYGWDGASDSLWSQSIRPILDDRELGATPRHVAQLIRSDADLSCNYRKVFGAAPSNDDEAVLVNVGKALAAFQETLSTGRTAFDQFRDALAQGRPRAAWTYSEAAQRGLKLFIGKGGCANCHSGPNFTNGEFFNTGLGAGTRNNAADSGRQEGVQELLKSRFNLLGAYNDDKSGASAARTRALERVTHANGEFKVPTLRNLLLTSPYGREGDINTLAEVVRHYANVDPLRLHAKDGLPGKPLNLSAQEQSDLVVFLESLSTFSNPWRPDDGGRCH
jgi:cytochrome c peroxidase